jgi:ABC-2 type transport system ATP-binding protein
VTATEFALRTDGVGKRYRKGWALRDCTLTLPAGGVIALVGPNGAGKTTLLRLVVGLLAPSTGTVEVLGHDVTASTPQTLSRVGFLAQDHPLYKRFTVAEMLRFGRACNLRFDQGLAERRLAQLGIPLDRRAGTLSGGQQQMVAVARAFITDAPVILADELSWGLAPVIVDEIFEAIQVLQSQQRSLLIVEQYVQRILAVAQYVYILHQGSVVFVGEPGQCNDEALFERYLGSVA